MVKAAANGSDLELSDPYRKKIGWVVDVLRDSDKKKMGEISLSVDLLPPRRNKQGKVVWSLPNDVNMVPRLGLNEEKLVFAEYRRLRKEKKDANRERAKSKSSQRSKSAVIEDTINTSNLEEQVKEQAVLCVQTIWRRFQARTLYQTKKKRLETIFFG
uniref:Uncharacterized protein n=1 Tax=Aureoumbra lagunensis TaxID=44058 RepID=A0A7S3NGH1_9STRA|mmetsp:Transcript_21314/g.32680  ORF Transcript_21314/g.32680 Transcript_21314/m.32680 type:complete len:158 (+) Transcript_21314:56-529(+)